MKKNALKLWEIKQKGIQICRPKNKGRKGNGWAGGLSHQIHLVGHQLCGFHCGSCRNAHSTLEPVCKKSLERKSIIKFQNLSWSKTRIIIILPVIGDDQRRFARTFRVLPVLFRWLRRWSYMYRTKSNFHLSRLTWSASTGRERKMDEPISEYFSRQGRNINPGSLAFQDISEGFKVRISTSDRRVFHLECRDVRATCYLIIRIWLPYIIFGLSGPKNGRIKGNRWSVGIPWMSVLDDTLTICDWIPDFDFQIIFRHRIHFV
jgi:hypothetical protein